MNAAHRRTEAVDSATLRLHDLTDALENVPAMLCAYGQWHVEENIDEGLKRYDKKWFNPDASERKLSLMRALENAKKDLA